MGSGVIFGGHFVVMWKCAPPKIAPDPIFLCVSILTFAILLVPQLAGAQGWIEYVSRQDFYAINFPGEPRIERITWISEQGANYPGRVYSAENGSSRFAITVVDYTEAEKINAERAKTCPPDAQTACSGSATMGVGSWIVDLQGALAFAIGKFLTRPGSRVTFFGWFYQDLIEGLQAQITNVDNSRTFVATHMHNDRLYVIEGTVPAGAPQPGLFQQSMQFLDQDGKTIRYETVYSNRYPRPRRSGQGGGAAAPGAAR
jgi:hypothetical protein